MMDSFSQSSAMETTKIRTFNAKTQRAQRTQNNILCDLSFLCVFAFKHFVFGYFPVVSVAKGLWFGSGLGSECRNAEPGAAREPDTGTIARIAVNTIHRRQH